MECSVEGCSKPVQARTWCHAHYMRWYKRGGDPSENRRLKEFRPPPEVCAVADCPNEVEAWGWCRSHYALAKHQFKINPRECDFCAKWYVGRRSDSQFCSRECKGKQRLRDGRAAASSRKSYMKREWGLGLEEYHRMLADQGGCCGICGGFDPKGRGRFIVDHDHKTGKVRGLLCNDCNLGLGKLGDNVELLRRAVAYLEP